MKGRVILIDPGDGDPAVAEPRSKAALIVDGRVEDLIIDARKNWQPGPGDIFRARVTRTAQAGAVFAHGVLGADFDFFIREGKGLRSGEDVLLQVSAYAEPGKAIPASTRILHKMRYLIHTPGAPGVNISRQIRDPEERQRLSGAMSAYSEHGFIVRSAAAGVDETALVEEAEHLLELGSASARGDFGTMTCALNCSARLIAQLEWTNPEPNVIHFIEGGSLNAELDALVEDFDGDPFDHFGVWDEIERLKSPRVDLPSGAWMAIEATRAMVTVDVNTGDQFSGGAALTANIEAARELPRQLRLHGLGGQITIDFAPLKKMHRRQIEEALKAAFRRDPIATTLAGWTPLGNFELQRKRERRPLSEVL